MIGDAKWLWNCLVGSEVVWGTYLDAVGIALSGWLIPSSQTVICVEHDVLHNKHNMYS